MSVVKVTLTHSASRKVVPEKRYALTQTIASIKQNVYGHFGTCAEACRLQLFDEGDVLIESNMLDENMLGYYQCRDGYRIHVVDVQPSTHLTDLDDVSQIEKYTISEDAYLKRGDNARAFKQRMLAQMRAEDDAAGVPSSIELDDSSYKETASKINVGDRCQCQPGDRLGTVRYVGRIAALKPGYWVGVEFDEPVGKSDGCVKGARVFACQPGYGGILRPDKVVVGDYPPEEL